MSGVIVGGWEFVIAAYALTAIGFVVYGVSLMTRLREASRND
ncbi:MAG TPA: hypothetical protein VHK90_00030 [Thermoanaerobaculia bacterium]|nr:hypothetical protein [Thermoanaerobaculia bacterium]